MMFEASQQLHDILKAYSSMFDPLFVKSIQSWRNSGQWKRPKSVKIKHKLGIPWPAYGHHTWPRDRCRSDRNAQDWDDFTLYPVMPWIYVLEQLGASHVLARHRKNQDMSKQAKIQAYSRIIIPREDTSTTMRSLEDPSSPVEPGATKRDKDS